MAEIIQFDCPICGTHLRLPLALAASQGPCPRCLHEIVAPDPYTGVGAHSAPPVALVLESDAATLTPETASEDGASLSSTVEPSPTPAVEPPAPALSEPSVPDSWPAPVFTPQDLPTEAPPEPLSSAPSPDPAFLPFAVPPEPVPVPVDQPVKEAPEKICSAPPATALILACILTGILMLILGTLLGLALGGFFKPSPTSQIPIVASQLASEPEHIGPSALPSIPSAAPPIIQIGPDTQEASSEPSEPVPTLEPTPSTKPLPTDPTPAATEKVSAAAEATLKAFLEAPDWASRSVHVLFPDRVREAMESYSRVAPDGPTPFASVTVQQSQVDPSTGLTTFIFLVVTDSHTGGIPVAVKETSSGWLVDWETFIEFRDALFSRFAEGPPDRSGRFHLILSPPPAERAASTENEYFSSFLISSPLGEEPRLAFVKKETEAHHRILTATQNGGIFTPVLEVTKRKTSAGQFYLEIVSVTATNWLPQDDR